MKAYLLGLLAGLVPLGGAAIALDYTLPDETAVLTPGPGVDLAEANCTACHSVDYILTQPPGKDAAFWDGVVDKMIKVMHAPIDPDDATAIKTYLVQTYGKP